MKWLLNYHFRQLEISQLDMDDGYGNFEDDNRLHCDRWGNLRLMSVLNDEDDYRGEWLIQFESDAMHSWGCMRCADCSKLFQTFARTRPDNVNYWRSLLEKVENSQFLVIIMMIYTLQSLRTNTDDQIWEIHLMRCANPSPNQTR